MARNSKPNKAAQALVRLRWAKDKERNQPREAGKLGGRPPIVTPCPKCGRLQPSVTKALAHCRVTRTP